MKFHWKIPSITELDIARARKWLTFLVVPLLVNGFLWRVLVVSQQTRVRDWRDAKALSEQKPKLKTLLTEGHQIRLEEANHGFSQKDSQGAMQMIQQSAARYNVQVKETHLKGGETRGEIPVELQLAGSFSKLSRWMSDVESQSGFRIDSWTLSKGADQCTLNLKATLFLGGAS